MRTFKFIESKVGAMLTDSDVSKTSFASFGLSAIVAGKLRFAGRRPIKFDLLALARLCKLFGGRQSKYAPIRELESVGGQLQRR